MEVTGSNPVSTTTMSDKINIILPDGKKVELIKGSTGYDVASKISESLAKDAVAVMIDDELKDLNFPIDSNSRIENNQKIE